MKALLITLSFLLLVSSCSYLPAKYRPEGIAKKKTNFRVIWTKNHDPIYETGNLPIALNSPLIHDGILYAGKNDGNMKAYELENGKLVWSKNDGGGYHGAPIYYKDHIIYGTDQGRVFSRHILTGKSNYQVDLDSSVETQGVIGKGRIFFQTRNHKIYCMDVKTGKILWAYRRSVPFFTTLQRASKPLILNNRLFVGFADGTLASFNIEDGVLVWEKKLSQGSKFVDVDSTPVLFEGSLYIASMDGNLQQIRPQTGQLIRQLPIKVSRAPLVHKGHLVVGTRDGSVIYLDKNLAKGRTIRLGKEPISSLKMWKGDLTVGLVGEKIYSLDIKTLQVKESFSLGHSLSAVFGHIEVNDGVMAALSSRNRLYVFK
jgi:outer membrane protein assembly factor BamB